MVIRAIQSFFNEVDTETKQCVERFIKEYPIQEALQTLKRLSDRPEFNPEQKRVLYRVALNAQIERIQKVYQMFRDVFIQLETEIGYYEIRCKNSLESNPPKTVAEVQRFLQSHPIPEEVLNNRGYSIFMDERLFGKEKQFLIEEQRRLKKVVRACDVLGVSQAIQLRPVEDSLIHTAPQKLRQILEHRTQVETALQLLQEKNTAVRARGLWQELRLASLLQTPGLHAKYEDLQSLLLKFQAERDTLAAFAPQVSWSEELNLPEIEEVDRAYAEYIEQYPKPQEPLPLAPVKGCCLIQ